MSRTEVVINTTGMTFEDVLAVARHDAKVVIAPATNRKIPHNHADPPAGRRRRAPPR